MRASEAKKQPGAVRADNLLEFGLPCAILRPPASEGSVWVRVGMKRWKKTCALEPVAVCRREGDTVTLYRIWQNRLLLGSGGAYRKGCMHFAQALGPRGQEKTCAGGGSVKAGKLRRYDGSASRSVGRKVHLCGDIMGSVCLVNARGKFSTKTQGGAYMCAAVYQCKAAVMVRSGLRLVGVVRTPLDAGGVALPAAPPAVAAPPAAATGSNFSSAVLPVRPLDAAAGVSREKEKSAAAAALCRPAVRGVLCPLLLPLPSVGGGWNVNATPSDIVRCPPAAKSSPA